LHLPSLPQTGNQVKGVPNVGEVIEAARKSADVGANSLRGYVIGFRNLAAAACGVRPTVSRFDYRSGGADAWHKRVDSIRLDKLPPKRIQDALDRRIDAAKGNPLAERKARISAASTLRQAKALFSIVTPNKAKAKHRRGNANFQTNQSQPTLDIKPVFENLPNPFAGVSVNVGTPPKYVSTVKAGDLMRAAQKELATNSPEAYKAFLLALGAGLRVNEIDNLQWAQIDATANTVRVMTTATFEAKTDSSEREVFVDPGLIAELEKFRAAATSPYSWNPNASRSPTPPALATAPKKLSTR